MVEGSGKPSLDRVPLNWRIASFPYLCLVQFGYQTQRPTIFKSNLLSMHRAAHGPNLVASAFGLLFLVDMSLGSVSREIRAY